MKIIILLITMLFLCGTANATPIDDDQHYIIAVIVWNNVTELPEENIPVTFGETHTLYTAEDGSVVYDTANLNDVRHGTYVTVSCKYGTKLAPIVLCTYEPVLNETSGKNEMRFVQNWGIGITFNEPSESIAIEAFAAMGFAAIALGGGRYILRRKKKIIKQEDTMKQEDIMTENNEEWKLKRDFGVRALIATLTVLGYIGVTGLAVYKGDMNMLESISVVFLPVVMAMIVFYFNGSAIRDAVHK